MFSFIFSLISGFFGKVFSFVLNNPKPFIYIGIVIAIFFSGFFLSKSHWQTPLIEKISKYEKSEEEAKKKLKQISEDAKLSSEKAEAEISAKNAVIDSITSQYETEKAKKQKVSYVVKDPRNSSQSINLEFNTNGNMICDRFSDAYHETLNKIITEANGK